MSSKEEVSNSLVDSKDDAKVKWKDAGRQLGASFCAYVIVILSGVNFGFSAVLLPQLDAEGSDLRVTFDQASWIASVLSLAQPIGSLSLGPLMDRFGRKNIRIFTCIPFVGSWLLLSMAHNVWQLYMARALAGIGSGLSTVALVYVSEISHPMFRPMLLAGNSIAVSLGILITCALGVWFTWRTISVVFTILSILSVIVVIPLPESPHWLMTFSEPGHPPLEAISNSLHWLYRNPRIYEEQYNLLMKTAPKCAPISSGCRNRLNQALTLYSLSTVYKPTVILAALFVLQQLSGAYAIIFYAVDIFKKIGGDFGAGIDAYVSLALLGAIRFLMSIISAILSKLFGRKPLLYASGLGMSVSTLGVVLRLAYFPRSGSDYVPLVCILFYISFASMGYFVIPWSLIGELIPVKVRATMGGVLVMWSALVMFIVVKMFPLLLEHLGIQMVFACFSLTTFISTAFVYFFVPETFEKTFIEIEEYFQNTNQ